MNVFIVVFTKIETGAVERLKSIYPEAYEMIPATVYLIRSDELSTDIAEQLGIKADPRLAMGVVFKANHAYSGYTARTLWEWLD